MSVLKYDLHIHSCLSPCAEDEMTPANIAAYAALLELDVVAVTDHNSCKNCPAFFAMAEEYGIVPIAGMELCTSEEIHVLCLFSELDGAMRFGEYVDEAMYKLPNLPERYGRQVIMNEADEEAGEEDNYLLAATSVDLYGLSETVKFYGGVVVPAHIERAAFSLISTLGFVPDDCGFGTVEIRARGAADNLKKQHEYLNYCGILFDSDAHMLENIGSGEGVMEVSERTASAVIDYLMGSKH
ncbi:histidinol-phosphatase [Clostridia bacterium]|nr:histidinol-phosphatase [Clostridia bacterium]